MRQITLFVVLFQISLFGYAEDSTAKIEAKVRTATQEACNDSYCYFVKQGRVYKSKRGENIGYSLRFSNDLKSVITFKGQLFAVQNNGTMWTWGEGKMCWIRLAKNVDKLQTDDNLLFATSKKGSLSTYDGSSFSYRFSGFEGLTFCSAENVLSTKNFSNVSEVAIKNGKVSVVKTDGSSSEYYNTVTPTRTTEPTSESGRARN